jgi:hypothetical protein
VSGPYRDEREALRAENSRLRGEVASLRGGRRRRGVIAGVIAALVLLDAGGVAVAGAWINAPSDAKALGGMALLGALAALNLFVLYRLLRGRKGSGDG